MTRNRSNLFVEALEGRTLMCALPIEVPPSNYAPAPVQNHSVEDVATPSDGQPIKGAWSDRLIGLPGAWSGQTEPATSNPAT